ncbi:hypothetical protein ACLMJK_001960 [Lecanora helva]
MVASTTSRADRPTSGTSDGSDPVMPIAIVGLAGRYPGDAANPEKLWDLISGARSAMTEIPKDRFNIDAFYHPHNERSGAINVRGGHYMDHQDIDAFDAPFFSITPNEAKAMDPQQRMALECTFEAMENAGIRMESLAGSDTSCYVGSFSKDYTEMMAADQEDLPLYYGIGTGTAILSNRISWFFDLKGPSISIDTACSSALVALHLGCQSLRTGESKASIVGGVNFMLIPGVMTAMTALHFLSPDSKCHSFDAAANGYARGEGASFVVLKPLDQALKDHDVIRAVIRNTAVNQDGNTPGITVPSADSQEAMIRKCYEDAGLSLADTQYAEAHGTGTQAGDPQEAAALSGTLGKARPPGDPLLIGSIKTNIGHLEGASGLAQVTKAVFALEKAEIPPSLWYQEPNSRIPMDDWNLRVVDKLTPWPSEAPRRISINSFGYGGTNAHCILDDAYNFMKNRRLQGNHNTFAPLISSSPNSSVDSGLGSSPSESGSPFATWRWTGSKESDYFADKGVSSPAKLFIWSSNEQTGTGRVADLYRNYLKGKLDSPSDKMDTQLLEKLARTMASRRSIFPWRSYGVASTTKELCGVLENPPVKAKRAPKVSKLGFIFTGQGAQWYAMGRELCTYQLFLQSLEDASAYLVSLGATWSLLREFLSDEKTSRINSPAFSQPICTALQVALVDLLDHWGVKPSAVAGHSSGEIAAAYAKGAISREAAWAISYHRGRLSAIIPGLAPSVKGSMMATSLSADAVQPFMDRLTDGQAVIACKNSPSSTTISGDLSAIIQLEAILKKEGHFARRLVVETAYHSPHMQVIADLYLNSIQTFQPLSDANDNIKMFSSVTGNLIESSELTPQYWLQNMVGQVDLVSALQSLIRHSPGRRRSTKPFVDVLVELGPHSALQGPIKQTLKGEESKLADVSCMSVLQRGKDACCTTLDVVGRLFQHGYPVKIAVANNDENINGKDGYLVDIPPFAWNRNNKYWAESQVSKNYRFRKEPRTDLLGATIPQGNSIEPLFRNVMKINEIPWVEHHKVQGTILYPAAGMLVMAIQAAAQTADPTRTVEGYEVQDVLIGKAIVIPPDDIGTETMLSLRPWRHGSQDLASNWDEFRIFSRHEETWELNCSGLVRTKYESAQNEDFKNEDEAVAESQRARFQKIESECYRHVDAETHYENLATIGLGFSGPFKSIVDVHRGNFKSRCDVKIPDTKSLMPHNFEFPHVIHPSTLDCIIQVGLAGATPAEEDLTVALIPTFVGRLFVSAKIPKEPGSILRGTAAIGNEGYENAQASFIVFDDRSQSPVVTFDNIKSTALRHGELGFAQAASMRKLASYFHWQEDIDKLDSESLKKLCSASREKVGGVESTLVAELEHAAFIYMKRVLKTCTVDEAKGFAPHFRKFYELMQNTCHRVVDGSVPHQNRAISWLQTDEAYESDLLRRVAQGSTDGAVMCRHGENLPAIMRGDTMAIEVLMQDDLLHNFYQHGVGCPQIYAQVSHYMDLLAHKKPDMKILEIGAGTGGVTLGVLEALGGQNGSSPRLAEYTFTDISTGFFEKANKKFKSWLPFMKFAKLDISEDPIDQGLKMGDYDVVIAANVLHATPSMDQTLSHVKKLLKPDGKLVLSEITNPLLRIHMIVGSFDGWWAGDKDGREWGPTMTEETWDSVLRRNSFSGLDLVAQDIPDPDDHFYSLMVSTASSPEPAQMSHDHVIIEPQSPGQELKHFIEKIQASLKASGTDTTVLGLKEASKLDVSSKSCIFLLDCDADRPMLPSINDDEWEQLKTLIMTASESMWITRGATIESENPMNNLMTGMARCIRAENPSLALTTLDLDYKRPIDDATNIDCFLQVLTSASGAIYDARPDWEYAVRDNKILIQRILLEQGVNDLLSTFLVQPKPEQALFKKTDRALALRIGTHGRLDSFRFEDDPVYGRPLKADDIEIEVKGVGLNFKDIMAAMGQLQELDLGLDCSGIVSRVGSGVTHTKPGDKVMTWTPGSFRSFVRSPESMCVQVPEGMGLGIAASLPLVYSTAYYALYEVARIRKGETVLIHGAAGGVGQAAIILAYHLGAEVFATVSSSTKKQVLIEQFGVPEDHIFNSRDDSFVSGVMRMTNQRGVNVVLNSLAGEALQNSWHCIAWFGRFVEMGRKDIESNTGLDMAPFIRNISFHSINLVGLLKHDVVKCSEVMREVVDLFRQGIAKPIHPTTFMPFSQIEEGFRLMQMGKHIGKIVFEVGDNDLVPVIPARIKPIQFDPDFTYLLSGGLGGLGRSIAQWMVRQGAKHIAFLSRSGDKKPEAKETIQALRNQGATVAAYSCDIANTVEVQRVVDQCSNEFPPIRGAIQGAMVLKDATYQNMTHDQYLGAIHPKVQGTWNLHAALPSDMDFFVLLSSSAGVAGSRGQGNYAAGNAFQDALANYRHSKGLKASSIDLGMILDIGYVAETANKEVAENTKKWSFAGIREQELHAMIQSSITGESVRGEKVPSQLITGLGTGGMANLAGFKIPWWFNDAKFAHIKHVDTHQVTLETEEDTQQLQTLLSQATSMDTAAEIVATALIRKLAKSLMVDVEDIEPSKPISRFGVDSLLAVEVRSWLFTDMQADVSVFQLLSNVPISELVRTIASKAKCVPAAVQAEA